MPLLSMDWRRYRALPPAKRRLLNEALAHLFMGQVILVCVPFRRMATWLGAIGIESTTQIPDGQLRMVEDISWAVQAMAGRVPWDSQCLAQAVAGYRMLMKRGIPSTLYFGVKKDPQAAFSAHAWLRCGSCIVTGAVGHSNYRIICQFSRTVLQPDKRVVF